MLRVVFCVYLFGVNEVFVVMSMVGGVVVVELMNDLMIVVFGFFFGLESVLNIDIVGGVYIYMGLLGENGDVIFLFNVIDEGGNVGCFLLFENIFIINEDQLEVMMSCGLYVNIYFLDQLLGEICGQLMLESQVVFIGYLLGIFEVLEVVIEVFGVVQVELFGNWMIFVGIFVGLSSFVVIDIVGGVYIYVGYVGQMGDVVILLVIDLNSDNFGGIFVVMLNIYQLEEDQIELMKDCGLYVNIYSIDIQLGELCVQVLFEVWIYFYVFLSGVSEVLVVNIEVVGVFVLEVNFGCIIVIGSFNVLLSMLEIDIVGGVYIYLGYVGENGGVQNVLGVLVDVNGINGIFFVVDNINMVSEGWIDILCMCQYYVNVYFMDFLLGEVCGQLLFLFIIYFISSLSGFNEVQLIGLEVVGGIKVELIGEILMLIGVFFGLESLFDENVVGGVYFYFGGLGMNGDVDFGLMFMIDVD